MLTVITQLQNAADALIQKYAAKLTPAAETAIDNMCDRVIEFLVSLNAKGVLQPLEVVNWFKHFEGVMDHLTNAYTQGTIQLLTVADGVTYWIEFVRNAVS